MTQIKIKRHIFKQKIRLFNNGWQIYKLKINDFVKIKKKNHSDLYHFSLFQEIIQKQQAT